MRKEIIEKILEEWNVCSCDNSALADRLLKEFSPAGEYIKKEDAIRAFNHICDGYIGRDKAFEYREKIRNGLTTYSIHDSADIEKIRAEIAEIPNKYPMTADYENGIREALSIIDKHIGGERRMTREEAIEEIKRWTPILLNSGQCTEKTSKAQDMAISALKGGWIPIIGGDKLPEHDVICCDNEGNIALGYLYFDEEENQIACDYDPYVMYGVVAYMELPEHYKKGE